MGITFECLVGTVYGVPYYTVKPKLEWWKPLEQPNWQDMLEWCETTFGGSNASAWDPDARWYANNSKFWFRHESDRTLFLLKWQ